MLKALLAASMALLTQGQAQRSSAFSFSDGEHWFYCLTEMHFKECRYTDRNPATGRVEEVVRQVPYTVNVNKIGPGKLRELVAFDRRGQRVDPSSLRMMLKEHVPVLLVADLELAPLALRRLNDERLVLLLPCRGDK